MSSRAIDRLFELIRRLRGENGCPWDREQRLEDVLSDVIEEAYELQWAQRNGSSDDLFEELGDVLFLWCFAAAIAKEGRPGFEVDRIADRTHDKIKSRHPHVFEGELARTPEESIVHWERAKVREREERDDSADPFEDVPHNLPPIRLSEKIQERAAARGFDWRQASEVLAKLREELDELESAVTLEDREQVREEMGDVFFSAVNVSRFLGVDAGGALSDATSKFLRRYRRMSALAAEEGVEFGELDLAQMDAYWERAKEGE